MFNTLRRLIADLNLREIITLAGGGTWQYNPSTNKITSGGSLAHDLSNGTVTLGTVAAGAITPTGVIRTGQVRQINTRAKVGAGAGWAVGGATDNPTLATMAASQSAGTLVVPVDGLKIGDTITAFTINAQIESAGGTVTIDATLRTWTNVAADPTDASLGGITQISVTADTAATATKSALSTVVAAGVTYYILITATTGSSCDIQLLSPTITVTEA
jgi:hypothetical protein